jgi:predicted phosphoribosyltransferase
MIFDDRVDAGRKLANALLSYRQQDVVVYALPRGGVVLGAEVARALDAPLDLIIVRKVGHPDSSEYAVAAVAEDGHMVSNLNELQSIDKEWFDAKVRLEQEEACRRRELYTSGRTPIQATGKIAIIVDDGLATGLTMFAAVQEVRHANPRKVIVAVPVAPPDTVEELKQVADEVIALHQTRDFGAIGCFYREFRQVTDDQVIALMHGVPNAQPQR